MVGVLYKMANFAKFQRLCHPLFVAAAFDWGVLGGKVESLEITKLRCRSVEESAVLLLSAAITSRGTVVFDTRNQRGGAAGSDTIKQAQVQRRSLFSWTLRNEGICLIEHVSPSGPLSIGRGYFCMLHTLVQFAYESLHMYGRLR